MRLPWPMSRYVCAAATLPRPALSAPGDRPSTRSNPRCVVSPGSTARVTTGAVPTAALSSPGPFAAAPAGDAADAPNSATQSPSAASARLYPLVDVADRTFAKFTFFKIDPAWHRRDQE